jgi:hypothetical protein
VAPNGDDGETWREVTAIGDGGRLGKYARQDSNLRPSV